MMQQRSGSIPACAGEPGKKSSASTAGKGLSPRVRGNPAAVRLAMMRSGSIPACAGEPVATPCAIVLCEVYPRVCGGTAGHSQKRLLLRGLSPRVRGNRLGDALIAQMTRSIPACAGEPAYLSLCAALSWVYPRVCGGTGRNGADLIAFDGLSPRVRGNPDLLADNHRLGGSIPACAGEPPQTAACRHARGVYPRVCGGTYSHARRRTDGNGLSPRVRGNRQRAGRSPRPDRSIPACAGEPSG